MNAEVCAMLSDQESKEIEEPVNLSRDKEAQRTSSEKSYQLRLEARFLRRQSERLQEQTARTIATSRKLKESLQRGKAER
jgi:hypothetical protein